MRSATTLLICFLLFSYTGKSQDAAIGPHGGQLKSNSFYKVELVECYEYLELYVFDKEMCPIRNNGLAGYVDFCFPDGTCSSSKLYHYSIDGFTAAIEKQRYMTAEILVYGKGISIKMTFKGFSDEEAE